MMGLRIDLVSDGIEEIHSRTTNTSTTRRRITILLMASRVVEVICSFMVPQRVRIPVSASALFYKNLQGALQSAYGPTRTAVRKSAAVRTRESKLAKSSR